MNTNIPTHNHTIECYGVDYDVVIVLGTKITLRCTQPVKGKYATMTIDLDTVIKFIGEGLYKLKEKQIIQHETVSNRTSKD